MLPTQKIISVPVNSHSYRVKLSEKPEDGDVIDIQEKESSEYYTIAQVTEVTWDQWIIVTDRTPGCTYNLIAVSHDLTKSQETNVTLPKSDAEIPASDIAVIPEWVKHDSQKNVMRYQVGRRSQNWKNDYNE